MRRNLGCRILEPRDGAFDISARSVMHDDPADGCSVSAGMVWALDKFLDDRLRRRLARSVRGIGVHCRGAAATSCFRDQLICDGEERQDVVGIQVCRSVDRANKTNESFR